MNKNFTNLSLNPKLTAQIVKGEVTLVDSHGEELDNTNPLKVTLVDPEGVESSGGGASADADYKIGSWDGTVTYASAITVTLAGAYPTINFNTQIVYIKYLRNDGSAGDILMNMQNGVVITHSAGTLTIAGADTPFVTGDSYEVGLNATPVGLNISGDAQKTEPQVTEFGHYTDVESIDESNLGIDATHAGAVSGTVFDDNASTFTAETIAEGYTIYNITDGCSAIISADTLHGLAGDGGAGTPAADSITSAALAGGVGDDWQVNDVASIPEVKRFVYSTESYKYFMIDVLLDSQDANNSLYVKVYFTGDADADSTDDIYWKDVSADIFGAAQLSADGIGGAARTVTQGIYFVDTATIGLKMMIKVVAENDDGTQDNETKIRIKKG